MVALLLLTATVVSCSGNRTTACTSDAVTARSLSDLHSFTTWVHQNGVQGAIGEVGWPGEPAGADAAKWNTLAKKWYAAADDAQVGVFAWSAAERWAPDYLLAIYRNSGLAAPGAAPYVIGSQAQVVESHLSADGGLRGVSLADGTFGASLDNGSRYSTSNRGTYGTDYVYPSSQFLQFLASRGIRQMRLAFTWERLQPVLNAPLDPIEVGRLVSVLHAAAGAGISVVLDLHNYGRYAEQTPGAGRNVLLLGSSELPASALADFWGRLAPVLPASKAISGYGIMDEPHDLPGGAKGWEAASALAVTAIRRTDARTPIYVGGYAHSSAAGWPQEHPKPWIPPVNWPVVYEAHQYFDTSREGFYQENYGQTNAAAAKQGWADCSAPL